MTQPPEMFRAFGQPILLVILRAFLVAHGERAEEITAKHFLQAIDTPSAEAPFAIPETLPARDLPLSEGAGAAIAEAVEEAGGPQELSLSLLRAAMLRRV